MRFLGLMSTAAPHFNVKIEKHSVQLISGSTTNTASEFDIHAGQSVDAILCADQSPLLFHDFDVTMTYVGQSESKAFSATLRYAKAEATPQTFPETPRQKDKL